MAYKKITIVFLPDGDEKVRQIRIPRCLFVFFSLFLLSAALFLGWLNWDYRATKAEIPRLSRLQKENKDQKMQLVALTQKIDEINRRMIRLKQFDHKLRLMLNIETSEGDAQFFGIGGSDPTVLNPDYAIEKAHRKLVRLMHQSLDNLGAEVSIRTNEKAELYRFFLNQKSMLASTPSIWPAKGWVISRFGYRVSPFTGEREFHRGLEISNRMNTQIIAPGDGVISSIIYPIWERSRPHGVQ